MYSNYQAPNGRLVTAQLSGITPTKWTDIIPESEHPINIRQFVTSGDYFFIGYQNGPCSAFKQFDNSGQFIRDITPPQAGQITCHRGRKDSQNLYYIFTNYLHPNQTHQMNLETGETKLFFSPKVPFNSEEYISTEIRYPSKDGTQIPCPAAQQHGD